MVLPKQQFFCKKISLRNTHISWLYIYFYIKRNNTSTLIILETSCIKTRPSQPRSIACRPRDVDQLFHNLFNRLLHDLRHLKAWQDTHPKGTAPDVGNFFFHHPSMYIIPFSYESPFLTSKGMITPFWDSRSPRHLPVTQLVYLQIPASTTLLMYCTSQMWLTVSQISNKKWVKRSHLYISIYIHI